MKQVCKLEYLCRSNTDSVKWIQNNFIIIKNSNFLRKNYKFLNKSINLNILGMDIFSKHKKANLLNS